MSAIPSRSRTLRQRTTGNPNDPNDPTGSMIKPAELVDVVEMTPLTLVDRRTYNMLLAFAWDRIDEDVEHAIPKAVLRGTHEGFGAWILSNKINSLFCDSFAFR
jgi:hypothetical protein